MKMNEVDNEEINELNKIIDLIYANNESKSKHDIKIIKKHI